MVIITPAKKGVIGLKVRYFMGIMLALTENSPLEPPLLHFDGFVAEFVVVTDLSTSGVVDTSGFFVLSISSVDFLLFSLSCSQSSTILLVFVTPNLLHNCALVDNPDCDFF